MKRHKLSSSSVKQAQASQTCTDGANKTNTRNDERSRDGMFYALTAESADATAAATPTLQRRLLDATPCCCAGAAVVPVCSAGDVDGPDSTDKSGPAMGPTPATWKLLPAVVSAELMAVAMVAGANVSIACPAACAAVAFSERIV